MGDKMNLSDLRKRRVVVETSKPRGSYRREVEVFDEEVTLADLRAVLEGIADIPNMMRVADELFVRQNGHALNGPEARRLLKAALGEDET